MPNPTAGQADSGHATTQRIQLSSSLPRAGQDPRTPHASVQLIVLTLDALVRAGRPETGRSSEHFLPRVRTHLDRLARELEIYLEAHSFLQLRIGPRCVSFLGEPVLRLRGNRGLLASILHSGDVVEILFKRGVRRTEIEHFVRALHRSPRVPDGMQSAAASLWECDFAHIRVCCSQDRLPLRPARFDVFDLANKPLKRADELTADVTLDPAYTAAAEVDALPSVNLDALPESVLEAISDSALPSAAQSEVFMPNGEVALQELSRVLIAMQLAERDTGTLELGRELLGRILELRLHSKRLDAVHDLLAELWKQSRHRAVAITFRRVVAALCREPHMLEFGDILRSARTRTEQASLVRKILELLGETAIEPLWNLYQDAEDDPQRTSMGEVLTAVAWKEPRELARHVELRPWNEVRDLIVVLGKIGGSKVLPALRQWTTHKDSRVRIEVVRALTTHDQPTATRILCDMLADPDYRVRQTAVWALATRGDRPALAPIKQIIFEEPVFRERSIDERDDFFRTCGRLADASTLEHLASLVQQRQLVPRGWKAELRRGAALALGESSWPRARAVLAKASKSRDARLRDACRYALASMAAEGDAEESDKRRPAPSRARDKAPRPSPVSEPGRSDATPPVATEAARSDARPPVATEVPPDEPPLLEVE
jgi:HEAT repeat protein